MLTCGKGENRDQFILVQDLGHAPTHYCKQTTNRILNVSPVKVFNESLMVGSQITETSILISVSII